MSSVPKTEEVEDPVEVLHRGELDGHLALPLTKGDPHSGVESVRDRGGDVLELGVPTARPGATTSRTHLVAPESDDLLHGADRETLSHNPLRQTFHRGAVVEAEECAGVAGGQDPGRDAAGDERG